MMIENRGYYLVFYIDRVIDNFILLQKIQTTTRI